MTKIISLILLLTIPTAALPKLDLMENCEYYKENNFDGRKKLSNTLITIQEAPPSSIKKIQYWTLPISSVPIAIPVDDYKMIGFFPDEENLRVRSILLGGENYEIQLGGVLLDLVKEGDTNSLLNQLKLGATNTLSNLECSETSSEQDLKRMHAVNIKSLILSGNGIYINKLDDSYNGFLYTSEAETSGISWQLLFVSPDDQPIAYKISRKLESDFKSMAGLLSQSIADIELQSEKDAPNWLNPLGYSLGNSLKEIRKTFVPELEKHGFTLLDSGSLSMIALEKK